MLGFKQYMKEMAILRNSPNPDRERLNSHKDVETRGRDRHIFSNETHHFFQNENSADGESSDYFYAVNKDTKKIDMHVQGYRESGDFQVGNVKGRKGSTIKYGKFLHALMVHGKKNGRDGIPGELISDTSHTEGSSRAWEYLHSHPDVKVTHHSMEKELPIKKPWVSNYGNNTTFFKASIKG